MKTKNTRVSSCTLSALLLEVTQVIVNDCLVSKIVIFFHPHSVLENPEDLTS